jgi:hypothetical protein
VVIIRVAPSDQAPHAVDERRKVYVRVDSQTEPHNLATLDQLEWLWDRRRKAEERRDALIEAAIERATWALQSSTDTSEFSLLRVWVVPHFYSGEEILPLNAVKHLMRTSCVRSDVCGGSFFPQPVRKRRSVPSGYRVYSIRDREAEYDELGSSGLLFSEMRLYEVNEQTGRRQLHAGLILSQIDGLLKFANLAYRQGQVWGLLRIHASLHDAQGAVLYADVERLRVQDVPAVTQSPSNIILVLNETIDRSALEEARPKLIKQAARSILWAFGYDWDEAVFEQWYSQVWR